MPGMLMLPGSLPVKEYRGKLVADSRDVAKVLGKRHKDVLRMISTVQTLERAQNCAGRFLSESIL